MASDALNWVGNQVPASGDTIVFNATSSKPATIDAAFTSSIAGVEIDAAYASTIDLVEAFSVTSSLQQSGSTITDAQNLTLLATCLIDGGAAMAGNGTMTVANGATLTLDGAGGQQNLTLNQVGMNINAGGNVLLTGGQVTLSNGATITNNGTFEARGDNLGLTAGNGGGSFVNIGSFLKTQSLLADVAPVNVTFTNQGTVQVQTGILLFNSTFSQPYGGAVLNVQASGDGEIRGSNMTIWDGTLQGDGILRVKGLGATLTWGIAQMNGSGNVIVDTGATMILQKDFTDSGFTITNTNLMRWTAGNVTLNNGAIINNQTGAVFQVESDATMNNTAGAATFNNYGTFRKIAFPAQQFGVTQMQVAFNSVPAPGQGPTSIDIQFNGVRFQKSGTYQASISIAALAKVDFSGLGLLYTLLDGTTFTGAGTFRVTNSAGVVLADSSKVINSATFEIGGFDPQMPAFLAAGTLTGSGVFRNTGTLNWRWGNIVNVLEVDNQGTLNAGSEDPGNNPLQLDSSILKNESILNWTRGDIRQITANNPNRKSQITNLGLFDAQNDGTLLNDLQNPGSGFLNYNTFQKSGGNGTTTLQMAFTTYGTVSLLGRTVAFAGGVTQAGGSTALANGTLQANGYTLNSGSLDLGGTNGQGTLTLTGGILTIANGGTLSGLGTINGSVTNNGAVNVEAGGAPVGQLAITGDYTQSGTLTLRIQQAAGQQYDRLQIGGTANLGGTLTITPLLTNNDGQCTSDPGAFTILTYNRRVGDFNQPYGLPPLAPCRIWAPPALGATSLVITIQRFGS